jgi:hypothetical protein
LFRPLTNYGIEEDREEPKEPAHTDYKYLKSNEGPLAKQIDPSGSEKDPFSEEEKKPLNISKRGKSKPMPVMSFERKKYGGIRMCQRCLRTKVSQMVLST